MFQRENVRKSRHWFLIVGGIFIILGMIALGAPLFMSLAIEQILGWVFLIGGAIQGFQWFREHRKNHTSWTSLLVSLLGLLVGVVLLLKPLQGVLTLTLILCFYFIAQGVFQILASLRVRPLPGWGWMLISGIVALLLGLMIWRRFPSSAAWSIGLLAGVNLLLTGWASVALALGCSKES
ncbi:MAG TPA: HdeD family acid-resistance protein [Synergistaceae bacterium]|nr:HdeD family acid-resistance protein [Synergistaceae bacterium]